MLSVIQNNRDLKQMADDKNKRMTKVLKKCYDITHLNFINFNLSKNTFAFEMNL